MHAGPVLTRRTFLADLGRGSFALAVIGIAGCVPGRTSTGSAVATARPPSASDGPGPSASTGASGAVPSDDGASASTPPAGGDAVAWERVNLGFVSAYILVRGGEAAVVDTGTAGSAGAIEDALGRVALSWGDVGHLVLTHLHGDHIGSAAAVMTAATGAAGYAGAADLPSITVPRELVAVGDGDEVFGLRIVETPGHTAGHIAVFDEIGGVLVAGDALNTEGGTVHLPGAQFTADMDEAKRSVVKLGSLAFETLLAGHGEPILSGASALVAELGAS